MKKAALSILVLTAALLAVGAPATEPQSAPDEPAPAVEQAAVEPAQDIVLLYQPAPAPALAKLSTGRFCDASLTHGNDTSCQAEAIAQGLMTCTAPKEPHNVNCSMYGSCPTGGTICKCTYTCRR